MGSYRAIYPSFWTDKKVDETFTRDDKFFYLYLLTNAHTNLAGCYEISTKQMALETDMPKATIDYLLERFEREHDVIRYDRETGELLLLHWYRYNWTRSPKFMVRVFQDAEKVKNESFKTYILQLAKNEDTVSIPYFPRIDRERESVTDGERERECVSERERITGAEAFPPTMLQVIQFCRENTEHQNGVGYFTWRKDKGWEENGKPVDWKKEAILWNKGEQKNEQFG